MNSPASANDDPDSAAIFAIALSLWQALHKRASTDPQLNLSECYHGMDQLMREVMRIANHFERWSCEHLDFDQNPDVWPYLMEDKFGKVCLDVLHPAALIAFGEPDCLRVAMRMRLPIRIEDGLPVPVDVSAANSIANSPFARFRIQTVRSDLEDNGFVPFVEGDEPFDDEFGAPCFGLYGVDEKGLLEHIADRTTYRDAWQLARSLAPGIDLPEKPVFGVRDSSPSA